MRGIMIATGYYDAQWRKYEAGGSMNFQSLMKIALVLDVSLGELFDGLGQWPKLSVAEIQSKAEIAPGNDSAAGIEPHALKSAASEPGRKGSRQQATGDRTTAKALLPKPRTGVKSAHKPRRRNETTAQVTVLSLPFPEDLACSLM